MKHKRPSKTDDITVRSHIGGRMIRIEYRASWDEFRVSVDGMGEAVAYYTPDPEDANDTAEEMARINLARGIRTSSAALARMMRPSETDNA